MNHLNERDLEVLSYYAERGNRELYWNYLAQHPGNDGYGLLALGVVRNDNMPGAVANAYAQNYARNHNGRILSEREWEAFGENLVRLDLERRSAHMRDGRADLALNLPALDVRRAHDRAFEDARISPNAWTPRELLDAAQRQGGPEAAEGVWSRMLDNAALGAQRGIMTPSDIVRYNDHQFDAARYTGRLVAAYAQATQDRANINPDLIGVSSFYHLYDRNARTWSSVSDGGTGAPPFIRRVTDPAKIAELDDARAVRLERQEQSRQFHPQDPYRTIARSPRTLADAGEWGDETRTASLRDGDFASRADVAQHPLLAQSRDAVARLDASLGRTPDAASERMAARLAGLAHENGLQRIDHIVLSRQTERLAPGENVFVVQGRLDDPAHLRAHMKTQDAVSAPVEQSLQRLASPDVSQQRTLMQQASLTQREAPVRSM